MKKSMISLLLATLLGLALALSGGCCHMQRHHCGKPACCDRTPCCNQPCCAKAPQGAMPCAANAPQGNTPCGNKPPADCPLVEKK